MMELYNILFYTSALAVVLSMLPQIVRCVRRHSAADVSMLTGLLLLVHCISKGAIEIHQGQEILFRLSCVNIGMITLAYTLMMHYRYPKGWRALRALVKRYWNWLA